MAVSTDPGSEADPSSGGPVESSPAPQQPDLTTREVSRHRPRWLTADFVIPAAAILFVMIMVAGGLSGSSLPLLSSDGSWDDSLVAGEPRPIRSDEYLIFSPIKIGQVDANFPDSRVFGMGTIDTDDSWRHQVPSRSIGHAIYSPFNVPLLIMPISQGFAAYWWGPFLVAFLGVFGWFRLLGARWQVAAPAAVLVISAPAAAWWSGWQLVGIAHASVACSLVIAATRLFNHRRVLAIVLAICAALAAAGLPWFYQPWAIVAAIFVGAVTLLWGFAVHSRRRQFTIVASTALAVFVMESIIFLLHERSYYEALANTLYPGDRRFTGGGVGVGQLLSSLFAATVNGVDGAALVNTNLSEFSSGWSIALLVALALSVAGREVIRGDDERLLVVGTLSVSVALSSWAIINWGYLARFQPLTLVAPERIAPFIGFFGITCLAILVGPQGRWERIAAKVDREAAVLIAAGLLLVTLWGVTEGRRLYLPTASWMTVLMILLVVGLVVGLVLMGRAAAGLSVAALIAVAISIHVNPLTHGIGALESSDAAEQVTSLDRIVRSSNPGAVWAGDDLYLVPLLNGTGVNSLSSFNDPVSPEGWRLLDPAGQYEEQWNRFSYIIFRWETGLPAPVVESPAPDVVVVRVDPCDAALDDLELRAIVSSAPLEDACLTNRGQFSWQGLQRNLYERAQI